MSSSGAITVASDDAIIGLIRATRHRLVVLAPALSVPVGKVLCQRWRELGPERVSVILDVDPEVYRLGYGQVEALTMLEQVAASIGTMLQRQSGIRIALVVSDSATLVYSPTPLLIEAGPTPTSLRQAPKTNAIFLEHTPSVISNDLGCGEQGVRSQTIGLDKAERHEIESVKEDLGRNPPQKFDIARKVRVFNTALEFVEFELRGCFLSRKTIPIPSDLMGLAKDTKTQRLLTSHFKLVGEEHNVSSDGVIRLKKWICDRYLITLPGYGAVVLRTNKPDFELAIKSLRRYVSRFQRHIVDELQKVMDANCESLVNALTPAVVASPPARWTRFLGNNPGKDELIAALQDEIKRTFGSAQELVSKMEVSVLFKGVTYELLSNPDFIEKARRAIPMLKQLHEEYDAAKGEDEDDDPGVLFRVKR